MDSSMAIRSLPCEMETDTGVSMTADLFTVCWANSVAMSIDWPIGLF